MSEQETPEPIDFGDLDETYENVEAPQGGSVESVPDGDYEMVIANAYPSMAKESGNRLFKWRVKVVGPRAVGSSMWRNSTLEPDRIKWFKKDMLALGIELPSMKVLNDRDWVEENLLGLKVGCTVRNKDGYCNIYFNKVLGKVTLAEKDNTPDESGGFGGGGGGFDDDDAPF